MQLKYYITINPVFMKKVALFYSFNSNKTARLGEKIANAIGADVVDIFDAEQVTVDQFMKYDHIIVGVSTWFDGELPIYWDEFVPAIKGLDLKDKKFAIYGLGDQKGYPENFNDGVGIFAHLVMDRGAKVLGFTDIQGYDFEKSAAIIDGRFAGLCLDQENQSKLTDGRINTWIEQLKKEGFI